MKVILFINILIFCYLITTSIAKISCLNDNNEEVDWFIVYKLPQIKHSTNKLIPKGLGYVYMTSNNYENGWIVSNKSINDSNSIIGSTLRKLYENPKNNYFYLLYNDQPPQKESNPNKGHNKGVVLTDKSQGLWLVHSVPHFPNLLIRNYTFPSTGVVYGQSFLCLSLDLENLNKIGRQLQYNEPEIYAYNLSTNHLNDKIPELIHAALNFTIKSPPWFCLTDLLTKNGFGIKSFAKSKYFRKDLYEDWLAPALQVNLLVETWMNGAGARLSSNCSQHFKINNIKSVAINVVNISFNSSMDHSKWAVSRNNSLNNWICIGDINRMEHQKYRGGGTVCFQHQIIAKNYQKTVAEIEECKK